MPRCVGRPSTAYGGTSLSWLAGGGFVQAVQTAFRCSLKRVSSTSKRCVQSRFTSFKLTSLVCSLDTELHPIYAYLETSNPL